MIWMTYSIKKRARNLFVLLLLLGFVGVTTHCSSSPKSSTRKVRKPIPKAITKKKVNRKKIKPDPFYSDKTLAKIYRRQAKRMKRLDLFKKKGMIGEADSAMLLIRDLSKLKPKQKKFVQKLVKVENSDRLRIVSAIQKKLTPSMENYKFVRRRLFELYRAMDSSGTYYYEADHWRKKN